MNAPAQARLEILGEDEQYLAVAKPPGLLVHPTKPGGPPTLHDHLCELLCYELAVGGHAAIVNRLDRETSGVVVAAKTREAAAAAGSELAARRAHKVYVALAFGHVSWEETRVEAPLRRRGEFECSAVYLEQAVHPAGAPAATRLRKLALGELEGRPVTLFAAWPETGRTHQIRVHLAHVGLPVVGDKLYAGGPEAYLAFVREGWTADLEARLLHPRHALHCWEMGLCGRLWRATLPPDFLGLAKRAGMAAAAEKLAVGELP